MSTRILENLVIDALDQAFGPEDTSKNGLLFHSDQGTQYTSRIFQNALKNHGIEQSVSRRNDPYDNAVAETFFKTLRRELVRGRNYSSHEEARQRDNKCINILNSNTMQNECIRMLSICCRPNTSVHF